MRRVALLLLIVAACRPSGEGAPDASASPQASAEPAPLAAAPTQAPSATPSLPEGGPPPQPMRGDERLAADSLRERSVPERTVDGGRERTAEAIGYTLSAVIRPADVPAPPRAPEVNQPGIDAAKRKTELRLAIDMSSARLRIVLEGSGWVLPPGTELRARGDRYGHIVVWPGALKYRPLPPGSTRALLAERRYDVAPISTAELSPSPEGGKRIAIKTRKVEVSTRAAKATFEIGKLESLGDGGVLMCRWLLDLMNAPPQTALCGQDELPMRAELRWTGHGSLGFDVTGVLKKTDLNTTSLLVPPANAELVTEPLPGGAQVLLTAAELGALRTGPIDLVPPPPPGDGLLVQNGTVQLRMLYLDGVPVAWVAPGARDTVFGLMRGRYIAQWRTFFGESLDPPVTVTVPGEMRIGVPGRRRPLTRLR
jgi:hypothetical protein